MTLEEFRAAPNPASFSPALRGLWHDARGDWDGAHRAVQEAPDRDSAWVHAYLHRKEGDEGNARYWYARAGKPAASGTLGDEWNAITNALLQAAS